MEFVMWNNLLEFQYLKLQSRQIFFTFKTHQAISKMKVFPSETVPSLEVGLHGCRIIIKWLYYYWITENINSFTGKQCCLSQLYDL